MKRLSLILISALCTASIQAQQVDFRGANHCGIYTNEKNLLKQWPEGGPQKLWVVNDAGKGNSSALVSDGFIYTAGLTESEQEEQPWVGGNKGRGALIVADDMFYMFDERRGTMGLARINPEKLDVVSEFRITDGSGACFSHPTIFDGVLYVRRGSALMAFNVKEP